MLIPTDMGKRFERPPVMNQIVADPACGIRDPLSLNDYRYQRRRGNTCAVQFNHGVRMFRASGLDKLKQALPKCRIDTGCQEPAKAEPK